MFYRSHLLSGLFYMCLLLLLLRLLQHLVPLEHKKPDDYFLSFITSLLPIRRLIRKMQQSSPIEVFSRTPCDLFIFLQERSHLVFRLLYNWKMMRWQMHIDGRGHRKMDRRRKRRRKRRKRRRISLYRWSCHLQIEREREEINKRTSSSPCFLLSHTRDNGNVYLLYPAGASRWNTNIIKRKKNSEKKVRRLSTGLHIFTHLSSRCWRSQAMISVDDERGKAKVEPEAISSSAR